MKELDQVIQPSAGHRLEKSSELVKRFQENPFTKSFLEEWQINIQARPQLCDGQQIHPGNLIFGDKNVSLDNTANLMREGQGKMFQSEGLGNVVIFAEQRNQNESRKLKEML